ncbi:PepSY1/2 domain-containing protein [Bacillus paranthracis]
MGYGIIEIKEQKISLNDAGSKGLKFLKDPISFIIWSFNDSSQYDNVGVFTYVVNENGVRIYPEAIQMKIALDDGSIVGFSAKEYLASHQKRTIPSAKLNCSRSKKKINPDVKGNGRAKSNGSKRFCITKYFGYEFVVL